MSWCSVFSPKVCDDQRKKKRSLPTNHWVFGLKRKKNKMVTPEAGRPNPLETPLFTLLSFAKNFSIPAIGVARIFDWKGGGPNHKSRTMTSSEICKKGTFCNTKISQNGRSEVVVHVWHVNRILLEGEEEGHPCKNLKYKKFCDFQVRGFF